MRDTREVVVLTGASGFIGTALIKRLAPRYRLIALDRPGPPEPAEPAVAIDFDLATQEAIELALSRLSTAIGHRIAAVVHLAAYYDTTGEPNPLYEQVNVEGSRRLIEALQGFEVEQFLYASTMLVHRPTPVPSERISEASPLEGRWAYPESKIRAEETLRAHRGHIPLTILRIAGVYDDNGHAPVLVEQIARIYERRLLSHVYPGMLCAAQAAVHVEDLADAVERAIERRHQLEPDVAILVGEEDALGYDDIQDIAGRALHGQDWATVRVPRPLAQAGAWLQNEVIGNPDFIKPWMVAQANDHYLLDTSKARDLLGWTPAHSLRETLPAIVEGLKRDPQGWYRANRLNPALVAWRDSALPNVAAGGAPEPAHTQHGHHSEAAAGAVPASEPAGDHCAMPGMAAAGGGDRMAAMDAQARSTRWAHFANIGLGLWLAASPWVFDATAAVASPLVDAVSRDRGLPSAEWRMQALVLSDLVSGLLIAVFGALSLGRRTAWFAQWAVAFIGIWLLFAPLVFWSPSALQYQNDLLVGTLVIAFAVIVPMMPGMDMAGMMDRKVVPPGWTYCPSTASQRLPIALMGLVGLLISRMLTAYQLGHADGAWEPFFMGSAVDPRNGTEEIITSDVSKAWPIADAGLGAVSYTLEILMAVMGTRDRWRTMPWMVTFFGILVIPLGVVSIYFIAIQPLVIGTWSTPALIAALAMLVMIPFAIDEVIAMGQYLVWTRRQGRSVLRTFFRGGDVHAGAEDHSDTLAAPRTFWKDTTRGITLPWTLAASIGIGTFLMLSRVVLGTTGSMANSDHVVGALVITAAIIATAESVRAVRFVNVAFGAWLVIAPWVLKGESGIAGAVSVFLGVALIALSLPRGRRTDEHYASWDRFII